MGPASTRARPSSSSGWWGTSSSTTLATARMLSAAKSARARSVIASSIAGFGRLGEHRPRAPHNRHRVWPISHCLGAAVIRHGLSQYSGRGYQNQCSSLEARTMPDDSGNPRLPGKASQSKLLSVWRPMKVCISLVQVGRLGLHGDCHVGLLIKRSTHLRPPPLPAKPAEENRASRPLEIGPSNSAGKRIRADYRRRRPRAAPQHGAPRRIRRHPVNRPATGCRGPNVPSRRRRWCD
jgi:hypothetical protein